MTLHTVRVITATCSSPCAVTFSCAEPERNSFEHAYPAEVREWLKVAALMTRLAYRDEEVNSFHNFIRDLCYGVYTPTSSPPSTTTTTTMTPPTPLSTSHVTNPMKRRVCAQTLLELIEEFISVSDSTTAATKQIEDSLRFVPQTPTRTHRWSHPNPFPSPVPTSSPVSLPRFPVPRQILCHCPSTLFSLLLSPPLHWSCSVTCGPPPRKPADKRREKKN